MKLNLLIRTLTNDIYLLFKSRRFRGNRMICPICDFRALKFGLSPNGERENVSCPRCKSLERHRAQWLFGLSDALRSEFVNTKRILHFAPDFCYTRLFYKHSSIYFTADYLNNSYADFIIDIQNTKLPDSSYDIIICNHILEHVEDDRKALTELYRLLKQNGVLFVQVPLNAELEKTIEDPAVTDPIKRAELFGQSDHLRLYGWDFQERLCSSGFQVNTVRFWETMSESDLAKFSLYEKEPVYVCKKLNQ